MKATASTQPLQHSRFNTKQAIRSIALNAALLGLAVVLLTVSKTPPFAPYLWSSPRAFHFGTVLATQPVVTEFSVRNLHPYSITVQGLQGSCGCIQSFPDQTPPFVLKPFGAARVRVKLDIDGKEGFVQQLVRVRTSDNAIGTPLVVDGFVTRSLAPLTPQIVS